MKWLRKPGQLIPLCDTGDTKEAFLKMLAKFEDSLRLYRSVALGWFNNDFGGIYAKKSL